MKPNLKSPDYKVHLPPMGDGTYGTVYRATYRGVVDRAIKVFKPERVDLSAMIRELEKLSSVGEHQGIVTLHDFDLRGDVPYYVMSLHADQSKNGSWKARTLDSICGRVDAREAGRLIDQIADAMAYLHRNQVLHCDLKPGNILLTDETPPHVKICDFGHSRGVQLADAQGAGTPRYSSPEQLLSPGDWMGGKGFQWDVYSFGVVAYKLITGKLPRLESVKETAGESGDAERTCEDQSLSDETAGSAGLPHAGIVEKLEEEREVVWPARARIDARRKAIITRCLALEPAQRPADMREVRNTIFRQQQERRAVRSRNAAILFGFVTALALLASGRAILEANRAREATARTDEMREEAEELVKFIVYNLSENLEPAGRAELLEHIAENAATYFSNMAADSQTERSLRSFSRILETRGLAALATGDGAAAVDSYQKAFNLHEQLEVEGEDSSLRSAKLLAKLGEAQILTGETGEARASFQRALELGSPEESGENEPRLLAAGIHRILAKLELNEGRDAEALQETERALGFYQGPDGEKRVNWSPGERSGFLATLLEQARLLQLQGDREASLRVYREIVDSSLAEEVPSRRPLETSRVLAEAYREMAADARARATPDLDKAQRFSREELMLRETIYWRNPAETERALALGRCLVSVAGLETQETILGRERALAHYRRALQILERSEKSEDGESPGRILMEAIHQKIAEIQEVDAQPSRSDSPLPVSNSGEAEGNSE